MFFRENINPLANPFKQVVANRIEVYPRRDVGFNRYESMEVDVNVDTDDHVSCNNPLDVYTADLVEQLAVGNKPLIFECDRTVLIQHIQISHPTEYLQVAEVVQSAGECQPILVFCTGK